MPHNTFKVLPADLSDAIHIKCMIRAATSGYIYEDKEYEFSSRINNSAGELVKIDKTKDFYVTVWFSDSATQNKLILRNLVPSTAKNQSRKPPLLEQLPSCIFEDCKQGDTIYFEIDGVKIVAEIDQKLHFPYVMVDPLTFEERLEAVRESIPYGSAQYHSDINKSPELSIEQERAVLIYAQFFHNKGALKIEDTIYRGRLGSDELTQMNRAELACIPTTSSRTVEALKTRTTINSDGTITLICGISGMHPTDFEWIKTKDYIHLFAKTPEFMQDSPEYYALTLKQPEFQHGIDIISFHDGLLTLQSRMPQLEAKFDYC